MAELIRDEAEWAYAGYDGSPVSRRLRVWREGPGRLVAVLTEHYPDPGTSITNAAREIGRRLAAEYPDDVTKIIEHYAPSPGITEHFDHVILHDVGDPEWKRLDADRLAERLPALFGCAWPLPDAPGMCGNDVEPGCEFCPPHQRQHDGLVEMERRG